MTTRLRYNQYNHVGLANGPGKFDLMTALFVGSSTSGSHHPVIFTTEDNHSATVHINEVGREDGSGESWLFEGFISKIDGKAVPYDSKRDDRVYGYFSTASRKGWMKYRTRER